MSCRICCWKCTLIMYLLPVNHRSSSVKLEDSQWRRNIWVIWHMGGLRQQWEYVEVDQKTDHRTCTGQEEGKENIQCQWVTNQLFGCIFLPYLPPPLIRTTVFPPSDFCPSTHISSLLHPILSSQLSRSCEQLPHRKATWSTPSWWWEGSSLHLQLSSEAFCFVLFCFVVFSLLVLPFEDLYFLGKKAVRAVQEAQRRDGDQ